MCWCHSSELFQRRVNWCCLCNYLSFPVRFRLIPPSASLTQTPPPPSSWCKLVSVKDYLIRGDIPNFKHDAKLLSFFQTTEIETKIKNKVRDWQFPFSQCHNKEIVGSDWGLSYALQFKKRMVQKPEDVPPSTNHRCWTARRWLRPCNKGEAERNESWSRTLWLQQQ